MLAIVLILGVIVLCMGAAVALFPAVLLYLLLVFKERDWWKFAVVIRVGMGILFLITAPRTGAPWFIGILGVLFILSGFSIPLLGRERVLKVADWWRNQPSSVLRLWGVLTAALGVLIIWSTFP